MRILLVDDDHELAIMLKQFFLGEGVEAVIAGTGKEAVAQLSNNFNAIILDIMLPDVSGIELLREIRKTNNIPIIMLTAKGDNIDRVIGLELGADDYVPKPCYPRELMARLKAVLRRFDEKETLEEEDNKDIVFYGLKLSPTKRMVDYKNQILDLTASEFNLLEVLLKNFGTVVSKDELSEKGIGRKRQIYDRSVDVHISNVRQKLHALTNEKITIETIRGVGYTVNKS